MIILYLMRSGKIAQQMVASVSRVFITVSILDRQIQVCASKFIASVQYVAYCERFAWVSAIPLWKWCVYVFQQSQHGNINRIGVRIEVQSGIVQNLLTASNFRDIMRWLFGLFGAPSFRTESIPSVTIIIVSDDVDKQSAAAAAYSADIFSIFIFNRTPVIVVVS